MNRSYNQLVRDMYDQVACFRAMERLVRSNRFKNLYGGSSGESRETIECIIHKGDLPELQRWIKNHPDLPLEEWSIRQLHSLARLKNIKYYAAFHKHELVKELS